MSVDIEIKKLELEKAKIDLAHYADEKRVASEKAELELLGQKLEIFERLEKRFGISFQELLLFEEGQHAHEIAKRIQQEFPVLSLKLEGKE